MVFFSGVISTKRKIKIIFKIISKIIFKIKIIFKVNSMSRPLIRADLVSKLRARRGDYALTDLDFDLAFREPKRS